MSVQLAQISIGENVPVSVRWQYASAAARTGASGFSSYDVGKIAHQTDNNTFWVLTATTPTWTRIAMHDVVDDTTPQLGGNLDVNGNIITSASDGNILIRPDGTGVTRIGGESNYLEIETDGTLKFVGDSTIWKDENFDPTTGLIGAAEPDFINMNATTIKVIALDGNATTEEVHGHRELQHDYKEGSNLVFHVHWAPTTTGSGDVKLQLEYEITSTGATPKASGTLSFTATVSGTAWDWQRTDIGTVTGTSLNINDQVAVRLFRDPTDVADTYTADVAIRTFGYHYEIDTLGSRQITTK